MIVFFFSLCGEASKKKAFVFLSLHSSKKKKEVANESNPGFNT